MTKKDLDNLFEMMVSAFVALEYTGTQAHSMARALTEVAHERFANVPKRGVTTMSHCSAEE